MTPLLSPTSTATPLVFSDGDRQINAGAVAIHPSLSFPKFQAAVAQRLVVSPSQISAFLVRSRKSRAASPDLRRKVPIDVSTDFAAISKERDVFILALLRRSSRRSRSRRNAKNLPTAPAPEKVLLRRTDPTANGFGLGLWDYESQLRDLQRQRERYLLSMGAANYPYTATARSVVCEECEKAKEEKRSSEFHWCVYDAVTVGFRSPVGPIERPQRKNVD